MVRQSLKSDPAARQRMIDAQRAESAALAAACDAEQRIEREVARRTAVIAQWDERVEARRCQASEAATALIEISGQDRAATLLGISKRQLNALVRASGSEK